MAILKGNLAKLRGQRVKCQKCGQKFTAGDPAATGVPVAAGFSPPTVELPPSGPMDTGLMSAPKTGQFRALPPGIKPRTGRDGIIVAAPFAPPARPPGNRSIKPMLLAAALLLLVGGGALATYLAMNSGGSPDEKKQAKLEGKKDTDSEGQLDVPPSNDQNPGSPSPAEVNAQGSSFETPKQINENPVPPAVEEPKKPTKPPIEFVNPFEEKAPPKNGSGKSEDDYRYNLPPENQKKVDDAIDRGIKYLKNSQQADGGWMKGGFMVGYAALPGLTLLECGVPTDDPAVQKAADFVRKHVHTLNHTYQLSLAIIFLDRLGDPKDANTIRKLAARLIAGQTNAGGWNYTCPLLTNKEEFELVTFLHKTRITPEVIFGKDVLEAPLVPVGKGPGGKEPGPGDKGTDPKVIPGVGGDDPPALPGKAPPKFKPFPVNELMPSVQKLPVVQQQFVPKVGPNKKQVVLKSGRDDNSNTQFAMMALWIARKHNVPMERTINLIDQRFTSSQHPDGGWGYLFQQAGSTPSMTCVGLIGLAIGHGSHKEILGGAWKKAGKVEEDPAIRKGIAKLSQVVGQSPNDWNAKIPLANLYFLWSVERVAMLYNLKTVGGKDWYNWAAHQLTFHQKMDGSWYAHNYHGSSPTIDTCLGLLILRRANLVSDLTQSLQDYIPITDPGAGKK